MEVLLVTSVHQNRLTVAPVLVSAGLMGEL